LTGQRNIDGVDHPRASINCFATRRSRTPARCFFVLAVACTRRWVKIKRLDRRVDIAAASAAWLFRAVGVSPTPKKASRTSDSPLPLPRALAARPTIA
jgi:hypothetical protein